MKKLFIFAFCYLMIGLGISSYSQTYLPGHLNLMVDRIEGIPIISINSTDTLIEMDDATLRQIFMQHNVYEFKRAFPSVDQTKNPDEYGLNRVYELVCNCNEDNLMDEIQNTSTGLYSDISKLPQITLLYDPNDYHIQDAVSVSGPDSALNMINAKQAWDYTHGDTNVIIGIVDQNLTYPYQWNHEDIMGKIIYWDTHNGSNGNFHGLFVAGCVAGNTDNHLGKSSIGFNCRMFFDSHFSNPDSAYNALLDFSNKGAKVLNASWVHTFDPDYQNMLNKIKENRTLMVAAAGNWQRGYWYPASYANVLSVTGTAFNYHHENWNSAIWNFNDSVDISAPGYNIVGLHDSCSTCYSRGNGSSFASPIVAGTAGLIFSINPCLTPADVTYILKSTANDTIYSIVENEPYKDSLGSGSLDAGAALQLADSLYKARNYVVHNGENIIWTVNKYVDTEILIESGGTLTVRSKILFNKDARITVRVGAKLIVNGGTLTSNCRCSMWSGIDVYGNSSKSQYYQSEQGVVEFKNGSVIENARTAVRTLVPIPSDVDWVFDPSGTGGIIIASNTTFRNNQRAVLFLPYENFVPINHHIARNFSDFSMCTFETTDRLADTTINPEEFVELNGVRGIPFRGCTFRNTLTTASKDQRGNGIYSINSSFSVREKCLDNYIPCTHELPSKFIKLNYGIKSLGTDPTKTAFIYKTVFDMNYTGIYLKNMDFCTVICDTFEVMPVDTALYDNIAGLFLDQCTGYQVEENYFYSNYNPEGVLQPGQRIGLVANNSGVNYNRIYNNRFYSLNVGILAENRNRNNNGDYGLEIKCNDFLYPNKYDIAVTKDSGTNMGIKDPQGTNGTGPGDPAGNTFSYTWNTTGNLYSDYYNVCENFVYWYHYHAGGANVNPMHHSASVNPQANSNNPWNYVKNESCPSSFSSGGGTNITDLITNKNDAEGKIDSISGLLALLVDGGDTPGTDENVQTSTSDQTLEIRNDLLSKTPYLSDSVMLSAAAKEDVLPPAIITEILSANPQAAKSDTVMQTLLNRASPLTDDQLVEIDQGWFVIGAKESLETKLSGFRSEYSEALKKILINFKNDSLNSAAGDSVIWYLNGENTLWAKYMLAFEYFAKGDTMNAENTLNNITTAFSLSSSDLLEHSQYLTYFEILKQLKSEGKSICEADSVQTAILYSLMNNSEGPVSSFASNVLLSRGLINYNEPYILPEEGYKSSKIHHRNLNETQETSQLKVYPNPARDYIIIEYILDREPENASIFLYDVSGKTILSQSLKATRDFLVVPLTGIPSGNYLCSLRMGNNSVQNVKFIIIK